MSARTTPDAAPPHGLAAGASRPVFTAPWQAQAFALTLALHERGLFSWAEWTHALSQAITRAQQAGDADLGDTYYQHWLDALEHVVAAKGLATDAQLAALQKAWDAAAERTPHGQPIELSEAERATARR